MAKIYEFQNQDVLTKEYMNSLVQTCQISSSLSPGADFEATSKLVPTVELLNTIVNDTQTFSGTKTFTDNVRLGTSSGGKINFGDGDYVYLHENTDNNLTIRATTLNLSADTISLTGSGKIPASQISITNGSLFGNASTLQGVIDYIAKVFAGTQNVTKLSASTISTSGTVSAGNVSVSGTVSAGSVNVSGTVSATTFNAK